MATGRSLEKQVDGLASMPMDEGKNFAAAANEMIKNNLAYYETFVVCEAGDIFSADYVAKTKSRMLNQVGVVYTDETNTRRESFSLVRLVSKPQNSRVALYKRDVFAKVGLFDESLNSLESWDFLLRAAAFFPAYHVAEPLFASERWPDCDANEVAFILDKMKGNR